MESNDKIELLLSQFRDKKEDNRILKKHGKNLNLKWNHSYKIKDQYAVPNDLEYKNLKEDL